MPKRIQRKRTKGWKMPPDTVYVGRGNAGLLWGNPFKAKDAAAAGYGDGRKMEVHAFRCWLAGDPNFIDSRCRPDPQRDFILANIGSLSGKDLACWCPLDQPCHADVLLELANQ